MSERLSLPGFSHRQPDDSTTALPATHEKPRPRHSKVRLILAGLGTFLVATALLLEFYVAPQLIAWPVSFNQTDTLTATNGSYYNAGTLQAKQDARLTYTLTIRSDAASSSHTTGGLGIVGGADGSGYEVHGERRHASGPPSTAARVS